MTKARPKPKADRLRDPTEAERLRIDAASKWLLSEIANERRAPEIRLTLKGQTGYIGAPHNDQHGYQAVLCRALGSSSFAFCDRILTELANGPDVTPETMSLRINEGLQFIAQSKPSSEVETLLLVQIWMTHTGTIAMRNKLAKADTVELLAVSGNLSAKLGNLFTRQIDALAKLRGGGKQQVEVRHVYVQGNAVIGDVHAGRGGGVAIENAGQAHATAIPYAPGEPGATMWGQDAGRDGMPISRREREAPLSDARRSAGERSAERSGERPIQNGFAHEGNNRGQTAREGADGSERASAGGLLT